jgi:hypothetical protein
MNVIEEGKVFNVSFCHFKTILHKNQYNLTFTKIDKKNTYEVSLVPIAITHKKDKINFDKDLRLFVCNKIYHFMNEHNLNVYFNINSIGLENEFLLWKFVRWINAYPKVFKVDVEVNEKKDEAIRFFEFYISLD